MVMLKLLRERANDYSTNSFIGDFALASKKLGILEAKIDAYQFDHILFPMLHKKEAISSMDIEGTQTTISEVFNNNVNPRPEEQRTMQEVKNHTQAILYGFDFLRNGKFTHSFIKKLHAIMMSGIVSEKEMQFVGTYKTLDNRITNSAGTVVFVPPSHSETKKYMDELIDYMNRSDDGVHPLIKAAIIHSQFESIHPFFDGNGRVGRLLISLYLYKSDVINFPFFYISEAISADKRVYYNMLTNSRESTYDGWIKFFLQKITVQAERHISYIDALNELYKKTKSVVKESINSPKYDAIIECLFMQPVLTASYFMDELNISRGQAMKYLNILESKHVLYGDDRKRGRTFVFVQLLELARVF